MYMGCNVLQELAKLLKGDALGDVFNSSVVHFFTSNLESAKRTDYSKPIKAMARKTVRTPFMHAVPSLFWSLNTANSSPVG